MRIARGGLTKRAFAQRVRGAPAVVVAVLAAACSTTTGTPSNESLQVQGLGFLAPGKNQASARLRSKSNSIVNGIVTFYQRDGKVSVAATVFNLSLGPHSVYIHETGNCSSPNAASAGPVWNPLGAAAGAKRTGDLPQLFPGTDGSAVMQAGLTGLSVADGKPTDVVGHAVVVHSGIDPDPKPQFGGVPNGWVACGVIEQG
jgi:superoxide dismutase, Cu-Zn family